MASTTSTFDAFMKDNYGKGDQIARLVNEEHVFLDRMSKETGTGRRLIIPFIDHNGGGAGATLTYAQAQSQQAANSALGGDDWQCPWGEYDAAVEIGDKVMALSASDIGAFFSNKKEETDAVLRKFGDRMGFYALADSGRSLGTFTESGGACTWTNKSSGVNVAVGDLIVASANDGTSTSHTLIGSPSIGYVIATNEAGGTFTVSTTSSGSAGTPSSWTGTMYAYHNGDFGGDTTPNAIFFGYGAWIPASDPSDTFCGVARSTNVTARSGVRLTTSDCLGLNTEGRIKKLFATMMGLKVSRLPKDVFLHPLRWQALVDSLESRGTRPIEGKAGIFNFPKVQLATVAGLVDVWPEKFMPYGHLYAPNFESFKLYHADGFPKIMNGDGLTMLRKTTSNDYEIRFRSYVTTCARAPAWCGRAPLPS